MPEILTAPLPHHRNLLQVVRSYYQLTKPRIILLLLITTAASMWVAAHGEVDPLRLLVTLLGGALAAAAANTINCFYDRDIDAIMARTAHRPLPSGRIQPRDALLFAGLLVAISFILLSLFANLLSALLAMSGIVFYVAIYTHLLKRHHVQNIVIGGAAGAIPPLVGWAAVTGELSWAAWLFFVIIVLWTPPHFWALALMIREEYAKVEVPMLPVVVGEAETSRQIFLYTLILLPISLGLAYPLQVSGSVYAAIALLLGGLFIKKAWALLQAPADLQLARSLFKYSIFYLMLLCAGMTIDSLPITHHVTTLLASQLEHLVSLAQL